MACNLFFNHCVITDVTRRTTKDGSSSFVVLGFFSFDCYDKFEVLCFDADSQAICASLYHGLECSLGFEVTPMGQGKAGFRGRLVQFGQVVSDVAS